MGTSEQNREHWGSFNARDCIGGSQLVPKHISECDLAYMLWEQLLQRPICCFEMPVPKRLLLVQRDKLLPSTPKLVRTKCPPQSHSLAHGYAPFCFPLEYSYLFRFVSLLWQVGPLKLLAFRPGTSGFWVISLAASLSVFLEGAEL